MSDDLDLLSHTLAEVERLLAGVRADQLGAPTPCADYDVEALQNHIVGWMQMFGAWAHGRRWEGDAESHRSEDPAAEVHDLAARILEGWRTYGTERTIQGMSMEVSGDFVLSMMITEYAVHGWDVATATGQPLRYTDEQLARVLARGRTMLSPEYRGPKQPFAEEVAVPADAPLVAQLAGWAGRDPAWGPATVA